MFQRYGQAAWRMRGYADHDLSAMTFWSLSGVASLAAASAMTYYASSPARGFRYGPDVEMLNPDYPSIGFFGDTRTLVAAASGVALYMGWLNNLPTWFNTTAGIVGAGAVMSLASTAGLRGAAGLPIIANLPYPELPAMAGAGPMDAAVVLEEVNL